MKEKKDWIFCGIWSAGTVAAVNELVNGLGMESRIFFGKGLISAALFALCWVQLMRMLRDMRRDRRGGKIAFAVSFFMIAAELVGYALRLEVTDGTGAGGSLNLKTAAVLLISALFLSGMAEPFFFWLMGLEWKRKKKARSPRRVFLAVWILVFLAYLPCLLAFYPGLYTYDIGWQWSMFVESNYSTHHPLLHTWLCGFLFQLGKNWFGSYNEGLLLHSLLQTGFLSFCIAYGVRFLAKRKAPDGMLAAVVLFYALFPFFPILGISTTKDIIYGALSLTVFADLAEMALERRLYRGWRMLGFFVRLVGMGLFRNNVLYCFLFVMVCLAGAGVWSRIRGRACGLAWGFAAVFAAAFLGTCAGELALERGFHAYKGSMAEMMSVPCQQLARVYVYHGEELTEEQRTRLFSYIPEEALEAYRYYVSDPVKAELRTSEIEADPAAFAGLWAELGVLYPKEYLLAPLYNTMGIWYLGGDSSCFVDVSLAWQFDQEHRMEPHSLLPGLQRVYCWFTDENLERYLPAASLMFYTSFYAWMVYLGMGVLVRKRRWNELTGFCYLFAYLLTLALGPCISVRYMMGTMLCAPIMATVMFAPGDKEKILQDLNQNFTEVCGKPSKKLIR